jgi:AcrR family transcriptional regulator
MAVKGRREEYAETTRAAIVAAAIERFTVDGFAKTSIDAVAESARVSKGAVYHHFADKSELFEATFIAMEKRLLANVILGVTGIADPWDIVRAGVDTFLTECAQPDFRRIALEEAPAALGWTRWKELEENYFLGLVKASLQGLAHDGLIDIPSDDLTARMFLAATGEAGLAVGAAANPEEERERAGRLVMRFLEGLR